MKNLPGPKGLELLKLGIRIQKNPLETYGYIQQTYGDVVYCPWPNRKVLFLYHPDDLRKIMKDNQSNYIKNAEYDHMKPLLGEGLITSQGEKWKTQRKIMGREFHSARIEEYYPDIIQKIKTSMMEIDKLKGKNFDLSEALDNLTFQLAGSIFFGANMLEFSDKAKAAFEFESARINLRMRRPFNFPFSFPTPENIKGKESIGILNKIVYSIMEKGSSENEFNILSKLMRQKPELDKKVIRDEVMTLLLAGHETSSNSLTWIVYHLCKHPEWQKKLQDDLKSLNKKASELTVADVPLLKIFRLVVNESLRLMPSAPAIGRMNLEKEVFSGHEVEAGTSINFFPYVNQRDPRFWDEPLAFKPERFIDRPDRHDDFSYFPFARGSRACIGEGLAIIEITVILAHLIENKTWELKPGFKPIPVHQVSLRSANGLMVKFDET